jgi:hypothetical protein
MYGASGRDWIGFLALVATVGALLGIGCERGWSYVRRHVSVEWRP